MVMHSPGNMIAMPKPGSEGTRLWAVYDAWNRLVEFHEDDGDGTKELGTDDDLLVTHEYDGLHRRTRRTVPGAPDVDYDYYYNTGWQVLEVRKAGDGTNPFKQFVWDQRYIDSPIVRFHDENTDGDYDDPDDNTLYYTNDANFNVTAVVDAESGDVFERYEYTPYGERAVLNGDFTEHASATAGAYDNRLGFQGLAHDFETGLIHQRTRPWHSTFGRFMTWDWAGYPDGYNAYAGYHVMRGGVDPRGRVYLELTPSNEDILEQGPKWFWDKTLDPNTPNYTGGYHASLEEINNAKEGHRNRGYDVTCACGDSDDDSNEGKSSDICSFSCTIRITHIIGMNTKFKSEDGGLTDKGKTVYGHEVAHLRSANQHARVVAKGAEVVDEMTYGREHTQYEQWKCKMYARLTESWLKDALSKLENAESAHWRAGARQLYRTYLGLAEDDPLQYTVYTPKAGSAVQYGGVIPGASDQPFAEADRPSYWK